MTKAQHLGLASAAANLVCTAYSFIAGEFPFAVLNLSVGLICIKSVNVWE